MDKMNRNGEIFFILTHSEEEDEGDAAKRKGGPILALKGPLVYMMCSLIRSQKHKEVLYMLVVLDAYAIQAQQLQ